VIANDTAYAPPTGLAHELARVYQCHGSAESAALRLALNASPSKRARHVLYASRVVEPVEGGAAFTTTILPDGYGVRVVSAAELRVLVQSGLRSERDRLLVEAAHSAARASALIAAGKPASNCFVRMRQREAAECRQRARALDLLVTVDVARAV
jgi:hypothetical protein